MLHKYHFAGYIFECNFLLSELIPATGIPQFSIYVKSSISEAVPTVALSKNFFSDEKLQLSCFQNKHMGFVAIWNNNILEYTPPIGSDHDQIKLNLLGSVSMLMTTTMGYVTLHACCVLVDGKAVLFCGKSGDGKSSVAAYFHSKGYTVLSDDMTPVNISNSLMAMAYPSVPRIKLSASSLSLIGKSTHGLRLINYHKQKYSLPIQFNQSQVSYPIQAIIFLSFKSNELKFRELKGWITKSELKNHIYRKKMFAKHHNKRVLSQMTFKLISDIPMYSLSRHKDEEISPDSFIYVEQKLLKISSKSY
ncbi:hypothetical protein LPB86_01690 [Pedobacter sp. MC2016-14]|uniref:hypothetical protein n=1 Tax=Pedobacter sp. MC2016-14 TaxID=2897327 RepID=UPI001E547F9B|nr:hypothetical protein [Pedobacter sp. MC2016-14]MCD0486921.1 hypothetical protein [Pedobacter sp. MC2016-14]